MYRIQLSVILIASLLLLVGCAYESTAPADLYDDSRSEKEKQLAAALEGQRPAPAELPATTTAINLTLYGELPGQRDEPVANSVNLRQVTNTTVGEDFDVDIDPTGQWIVFASTRHSTRADLYLKNINGTAITKLTSDPARDVMPTFSPDGKYIAFASDRAGNWDIYMRPVNGGRDVQITNSPSMELHPSFSPDGTELIFCALSPQSGQWEMVVVEVTNPLNRRILDIGLFPKFSPKGDKIVFQRARMRGSRAFSIWTMDYENGEVTRPTEIAAAANAAIINPEWSPAGDRIVFATVINPSDDPSARPNVAELWAVNLDGSGRVKLTQDNFVNLQPVWGAEGTIYFVSNRTGYDNIWALRPNDPPGGVAKP